MRPATLAEAASGHGSGSADRPREHHRRWGRDRLPQGARGRPVLRPARPHRRRGLRPRGAPARRGGDGRHPPSRRADPGRWTTPRRRYRGSRGGRWFARTPPRPPVVGITGTVGKTTTKDALATILRHAGKRVSATEGNLNNELGLPLTVLSADPRTEVLVLEMGATHAGDIEHLCSIAPPEVGILTAISPVHLDSFGSLEGLAAAKGELALALPESGTLVSPPLARPRGRPGQGGSWAGVSPSPAKAARTLWPPRSRAGRRDCAS